MPKSKPKEGKPGAAKAMKLKIKALAKREKEFLLVQRDLQARLTLLRLQLKVQEAENAVLKAAVSVKEGSSGVSVAEAPPQVATMPVVGAEQDKGRKPMEGAEGRKDASSDPPQSVQPGRGEAVSKEPVPRSPSGVHLGGGDAALPNIAVGKIRRPQKVVVDEAPKLILPVSNGFVAIRAIDEGKMYRPTWYFASVSKGEVRIRRRMSKGKVVGIKACGMDDLRVLEVLKVDALPKCNRSWERPDGPQNKQRQQQQINNKTRDPADLPASVKPTAIPSASSALPTGPLRVRQVVSEIGEGVSAQETSRLSAAARVVSTRALTEVRQVEAASAPQGVNVVRASPAQKVSDDGAWEEVLPALEDVLAEGVRVAATEEEEQALFQRRREQRPFPTVAKGRFFRRLILSDKPIDNLAAKGLALSTVKAHKRMLRWLMLMPEDLCELPIDRAMVQYFLRAKTERHWQATTTVVKMATAHGALRLLPLYCVMELPVLMKESVLWMAAMKGAGRAAKVQPVKQPTAASWEEVVEAMGKEPLQAVRMALLATWLTCGRGGDVLLLKDGDISLRDRDGSSKTKIQMDVHFSRGKTVKTRGPYTVFTQGPPPEYEEEFRTYLLKVPAKEYIFKGVKGAQIKDCLRRANSKLEQRSLRRGALQRLAKSGLSDLELLHYSGHTNVPMLRRYLNFGKLSGEGERLADQADVLVKRQ